MLSLGLNIIAFVNGMAVARAMAIHLSVDDYAGAASVFAVYLGLSQAAWALVGRGSLGLWLGFIGTFLMVYR